MLNSAEEALYHDAFPYYAELCALTEIRKKPGDGIPLNSGIGGHLLLYLNGVRRDRAAGYPVLELADPTPEPQGVGISVNAHYRNANWVASEGPDFLWRGALGAGEAVTRATYARTQEHAKSLGLLDGIAFHEHCFRAQPAGMSARDFMYELSIATDYGARFGRDITRVRVPLDRARMAAMVAYLNALNAPYRRGEKIFTWRVMNDNCAHVTHNALAAAGIWAPWPTGECVFTAAFNFPVPKNELVDLALRANDLPIADAQAMFADPEARRALLQTGALPTGPGALVFAQAALQPNELYDTARLRLIFFDNPFWGPYRGRLARILSEARYRDFGANLRHFESVYAAARAATGPEARFNACYDRHIAAQSAKIASLLRPLAGCR